MLGALILYVCGWTYSLTSVTVNVVFERKVLKNFFMEVLFTLKIFATNLLRGYRWRNIVFHIPFRCLTCDTNSSTSNMSIHYLLYYGDFNWDNYNNYSWLYGLARNLRNFPKYCADFKSRALIHLYYFTAFGAVSKGFGAWIGGCSR